MSWAKIDDRFCVHPKVVPTSLAARGLWVTALSWSSALETDGWIPDSILPVLAGERDPDSLVDELLTSGLWERGEQGYRVHDFLDWNPSHAVLVARREDAVKRVTRWRERKREGNALTPHDVNALAPHSSNGVVTPPPTRPDPTRPVSEREKRSLSRGTTWPDDFTLTEERASWGRDAGIEVAWEWNKFKDHALRDGARHKNWNAAWRYWIRNAVDIAQRRRG